MKYPLNKEKIIKYVKQASEDERQIIRLECEEIVTFCEDIENENERKYYGLS